MNLDLLLLAGAAIAMCGYVFGYFTGRCSKDNPCPKCSFHVNEQRVERLEAERKRVEEIEEQARRRHDVAHKGWGWATGAVDQYNCHDEKCTRNVPGRKYLADGPLVD